MLPQQSAPWKLAADRPSSPEVQGIILRMARKRHRELQWIEPLRFQRRRGMRCLSNLPWRSMLIRSSVIGIVIALVLYVFAAVSSTPTFAQHLPIRYFILAPLIGPLLLCSMGLLVVYPRYILIHRQRIVVQHGQSITLIDGGSIQRWKIVGLSCAASEAVLLVKRNDRPRGKNRVDIGISRRVDLIQLDRAMCRLTRAARIRSLRSQRGRNV